MESFNGKLQDELLEREAFHTLLEAKVLIDFGGNAEDVASTVPTLAAVYPDRASYALHYRGYSGSVSAHRKT